MKELRPRLALAVIALGLAALLSPLSGWARTCAEAVTEILQHVREGHLPQARRELLETARAAGLPVFLKHTPQGDIPVVLVTQGGYDKIKPFMSQSIGTQIKLQPDFVADHGILRIENNLIDVDKPSKRSFGELNDNGIVWKGQKDYLSKRTGTVIEVGYAATPEERAAAEYYQRMRRAAIVRVPYRFGENAAADVVLPNTLNETFEECFLFCKASWLDEQIRLLRSRVKAYNVGNVDQYLEKPEVQSYLQDARKKIMAVDPLKKKAGGLSPKIAASDDDLKLLGSAMPAQLQTTEEKAVFANWLIGLDSSQKYRTVLRELGISPDIAVGDMSNPRATAIFVYDSNGAAKQFKDASYTAKGKLYSWTADGQRTLDAAAAEAGQGQVLVQEQAVVEQHVAADGNQAAGANQEAAAVGQVQAQGQAQAQAQGQVVQEAQKKGFWRRLFGR